MINLKVLRGRDISERNDVIASLSLKLSARDLLYRVQLIKTTLRHFRTGEYIFYSVSASTIAAHLGKWIAQFVIYIKVFHARRVLSRSRERERERERKRTSHKEGSSLKVSYRSRSISREMQSRRKCACILSASVGGRKTSSGARCDGKGRTLQNLAPPESRSVERAQYPFEYCQRQDSGVNELFALSVLHRYSRSKDCWSRDPTNGKWKAKATISAESCRVLSLKRARRGEQASETGIAHSWSSSSLLFWCLEVFWRVCREPFRSCCFAKRDWGRFFLAGRSGYSAAVKCQRVKVQDCFVAVH